MSVKFNSCFPPINILLKDGFFQHNVAESYFSVNAAVQANSDADTILQANRLSYFCHSVKRKKNP